MIAQFTPSPAPNLFPWKALAMHPPKAISWLFPDCVTTPTDYKTLQPAKLECAALSPLPSPLDWILDPDKPRTLLNRILAHRLEAEAKEPNPHYRDDHRIAWLTCKWAFEGVHKPHVAATYRVLGVHPDLVWWHILQDRRARLDKEFSDWFDDAGNLRPDVPKKPQVSSPTQEAAERFTSERLAALIQFQPKKETA